MSATRRFKRWLVDKVTGKQTEPETPPSDSQRGSQEPSKTVGQSSSSTAPTSSSRRSRGFSMYDVTASVGHIVFHKTHILMRHESPTRGFSRNKDYILRKDPVTRKIKRIEKKDIGGQSSVFYYDGHGRLISD